jgi:hypothetical protein
MLAMHKFVVLPVWHRVWQVREAAEMSHSHIHTLLHAGPSTQTYGISYRQKHLLNSLMKNFVLRCHCSNMRVFNDSCQSPDQVTVAISCEIREN